jgi:hypothetical protein
MATNKSPSPRITEENLTPKLEDTPVESKVIKKETVLGNVLHIRSAYMNKFHEWCKTYGKSLFFVPTIQNAKMQLPEQVKINGMAFYIDRGVMVELPMNILTILAEKYNIDVTLGSNINGRDMRFDGNTRVEKGISFQDALN